MYQIQWSPVEQIVSDRIPRDDKVHRFCCPRSYTAGMLAEDLLEAGVTVSSVSYSEDADVGMRYVEGELPPEEFIREYHHIAAMGWGDMSYDFKCSWEGGKFNFYFTRYEDYPDSSIVLYLTDAPTISVPRLLSLLKKT